jgi:hypothetical protein
VLVDVYKSMRLYEEHALMRTYTYHADAVHLKSSTGAVKYLSFEAFVL